MSARPEEELIMPPTSRRRSPGPAPRERVRCQDLSAELVRDWLESACHDAVLDEDEDVFVVVDDTRLCVRTDPSLGMLLVSCSIVLDPDDVRDRLALLEALNRINCGAVFARAVLRGRDGESWVRYEHELFAVDGHVSRRQLVKLVRRIKVEARQLHRGLVEMLA